MKKIAGIPDGGGYRIRGRGYTGEESRSRQVRYRFIHTALDDRTQMIYSEILDNEQGATAAAFWTRACSKNGTTSDPGPQNKQRTAASTGFTHFYSHHRSHGALNRATPTENLVTNSETSVT